MTQSPYDPPVTPGPPAQPVPGVPAAPPAPEMPPVSPAPTDPPFVPPFVPAPTRPPLRGSRTIQGNVLAAFNKDHQAFRLVALPPEPDRARAWLAGLLGQVAVTEDVEDWNARFSAARPRGRNRTRTRDRDPLMHAVWVGLSLTPAGIGVLAADPARAAADLSPLVSLSGGAAASAPALGDTGASDPTLWSFGGPGQPTVHAVVTVAADRPGDLAERQRALDAHDAAHGANAFFVQDGETLPGALAGHEHFGFKDGVSQPGVAGFHEPGPDGARAGHPGTALVPAGQFVLGQPGSPAVPGWLADGSVHVLRRLEQDVAAWRRQLDALAPQVTSPSGPVTPERLGDLLMGRRKDGSPLAAPTDPARGLGDDRNDFDYANDPAGTATPCPAHIRKTHPRAGAPTPRLMRRGITFGPPFDDAPTATRGLVFNCFVTSVENQFEFIQRQWVNTATFPGGVPTGPDPVIGTDGAFNFMLADGTAGSLPAVRTVRTAGAVYALALSLPTLHALARGEALTA